MYKVSVIVPVYNLEHVLANTLESLALQTFRDFEIIVVDDNSMDGSAGLAEDVLNTFGVVHSVIRHQDNLGVSAARNTGLSVARGTYVIFFDGDDLAESNFVSCLYESISNNDVDAVFCGYKTRESKSGKETFYPSCEAMPASTQDAILRLRLLNKITAMMWAAIYKREYLIRNNICFTEKRIAGEDVEFVTKVIAAGAKLSFIKECLYIVEPVVPFIEYFKPYVYFGVGIEYHFLFRYLLAAFGIAAVLADQTSFLIYQVVALAFRTFFTGIIFSPVRYIPLQTSLDSVFPCVYGFAVEFQAVYEIYYIYNGHSVSQDT